MNKNLNKLLLVGLFALLLMPLSYAFAQTLDSTDDLAADDFDLTLKEGIQSPINKAVPLTFTVKSKFDSKNAFVRWQGSQNLEFTKKNEVFFSLKKGEEYTFTQSVKPLKAGDYRITAEVEAWRSDANYLDSEQVNVKFNDDLNRVPIPEEYKNLDIAWSIGKIVLIILGAGLLFLIYKLSYKNFREWLSKD